MKNFLKGIFIIAIALSLLQGAFSVFSDSTATLENYQAGSIEIDLDLYALPNALSPNKTETASFLVQNIGSLPVEYEIALLVPGKLKNNISLSTPISTTLSPGQVEIVPLEITLSKDIDSALKGEQDSIKITVLATQINTNGGFRDEKTLHIPIEVASPAPNFTILSPTDGETVTGETLIQIRVNDSFGISGIYVNTDQGSQQHQLQAQGANLYEVAWDSSTLPNGKHTLNFVAFDLLDQTASNFIEIDINN